MTTTALGRWLESELERRDLTQLTAAGQARIGVGTLGDIIRRGHVPKIETLLRLADFFDTPPEKVLRLAADLPPPGVETAAEDTVLIQELVEAFRQVPDGWKRDVLQQVQLFVALANRPPVRLVGEDGEAGDEG